MRFLLGILCLLTFPSAFAVCPEPPLPGIMCVAWQAPVENVDGSPLTDLDAYRIYSGATSGNYTENIHLDDETLLEHSWAMPPGDWYLAMTALDVDGNESAYSNEVLKTVIGSAPLPPIILSQSQTVFTVVKQPNRFILLPIGTVPAGTICDPNNSTNGHGVVPTDAVVWTPGSSVRPIVVVARCDG